MITELKDNQVFVFGSNEQGFHGAGAAGYAFCGDSANNWRTNPLKQDAVWGRCVIGNWCVWGQGRGLMRGHKGKSYAIATVERPGGKQVSYGELYLQVVAFLKFATANINTEFLVTPIGMGLAGWTRSVIDGLWDEAAREVGGLTDNIRLLWREQ